MWRIYSLGVLGVSALVGVASLGEWVSLPLKAQLTMPASPDVGQPNASPTREPMVVGLLKLAEVSSDDVLYALGAGDGQLPIAAVQSFAAKRVVVVENNPERVRQGQENAQQAGVGDRIQFIQQDPLQTDIREANVVALNLPSDQIQKLRSKLLSELRPGTRIVANAVQLGDWKPDKTIPLSRSAQATLFNWVVPADVQGDWQGSLEYAPGRRQPYTLRFTQQYQRVKGDAIVDGQKYAISKISLMGDRLTFSRSEDVQGQAMTAVFNGRVSGNTLKGIAELEAGIFSRKVPIIAKRNSGQVKK